MSVLSGLSGPTLQPQVYRLPDETPPATQLLNQSGVQSQDVRTAVDQTISPDATPDQRQEAYTALQGYVDRAAQGGDYEMIDDAAMRLLAIHALRRESIPMVYDTRVLDAVDREIAPTTSEAQRLSAYDTVQNFVDTIGGINDVGITAEALPGRTAALLEESCIPTLSAAVRMDAERILQTGVRDNWLPGNQEDDYSARFDAFTDAISGRSDGYREHLIDALLESDSGALKSWLTIDNIVSARDNGAITGAALSTITESVAEAYNNGAIDSASFKGMYDIDDAGTAEREYAQLATFLNGSDGPETAELRASLASDIMAEWNASVYPTDFNLHAYNFRQFQLAFDVAAGDASRPEILTNLLAAQTPERLDYIYAIAGTFWNSDRDVMATIVDTVARDDSAQATDIVTTLARMPGEHADWFKENAYGAPDSRVKYGEALASLMQAHPDAVFGVLGDYADYGARGLGNDTDRMQYEVNGRDLAAVLEVTLFDFDISAEGRETARNAVLDYVGEQAQIVNDPGAHSTEDAGDAANRLVVMLASCNVAVDRGFEAMQADVQARQEAVVFLVDLAMSALPIKPIGKSLVVDFFVKNDAMSQELKQIIVESMKGLTGELIDPITGRLSAAAKEQLLGNLSDPELAPLLERQAVSDTFREGILAIVTDDAQRANIQRDGNSLADDISEID